jgi:hypothetical protein
LHFSDFSTTSYKFYKYTDFKWGKGWNLARRTLELFESEQCSPWLEGKKEQGEGRQRFGVMAHWRRGPRGGVASGGQGGLRGSLGKEGEGPERGFPRQLEAAPEGE